LHAWIYPEKLLGAVFDFGVVFVDFEHIPITRTNSFWVWVEPFWVWVEPGKPPLKYAHDCMFSIATKPKDFCNNFKQTMDRAKIFHKR